MIDEKGILERVEELFGEVIRVPTPAKLKELFLSTKQRMGKSFFRYEIPLNDENLEEVRGILSELPLETRLDLEAGLEKFPAENVIRVTIIILGGDNISLLMVLRKLGINPNFQSRF